MMAANVFEYGNVLSSEDLQVTAQRLGGASNNGRVFRGLYRGEEVAVKILPLPPSCSPSTSKALQDELLRLARGRLHLRSALLLAFDLLKGLHAVHQRGVVMANLKPNNVLIDEVECPRLADAGLHAAIAATIAPFEEVPTPASGIVNYWAPEQFMDFEDQDAASSSAAAGGGCSRLQPQTDMWGFGCTLLYALTGRPPWAGLSQVQIAVKVAMKRGTPEVPEGLAPALRNLLRSCLQYDPAQRPSVIAALKIIKQELAQPLEPDPDGVAVASAGAVPAQVPGTAVAAASVASPGPRPTTHPRQAAGPPPAPQTSVQLPVHIGDNGTLRIHPDKAAEVTVPLVNRKRKREEGHTDHDQVPAAGPSGRDEGDEGRTPWLTWTLLQRALTRLSIPVSHRRYLLDTGRGELLELSTALPRGGGMALPRDKVGSTEPPLQLRLIVLDTRVLKLRVPVVLHANGRMYRTEDVEVDAVMTAMELAENVAGDLPAISAAALPELRPDVVRRLDGAPCGPEALLGSNALGALGLVRGGECHLCCVPGPGQARSRNYVNVIVKDQTGDEVYFRIAPLAPLEKLMKAYCNSKGIDPGSHRFLYLTTRFSPTNTPESLGMKGDDNILDVVLEQVGGKPVICLWAAQPCDVNVQLRLSDSWRFSSLVPRPDDGCGEIGSAGAGGVDTGVGGRAAEWLVRALPDGTLVNPGSGGRQYSYLFWEAVTGPGSCPTGVSQAGAGTPAGSSDPGSAATCAPQPKAGPRIPGLGPTPPNMPLPDFDPARSFCVLGSGVDLWLYDALAAFGVPVRERTDFVTYWMPHMEGADWLLVSFADPRDYQAAAAALRIEPEPDMLVRVFMLFERLEAPLPVYGKLEAEAARVGVLRREGAALAVLEWGGMQVVRDGTAAGLAGGRHGQQPVQLLRGPGNSPRAG